MHQPISTVNCTACTSRDCNPSIPSAHCMIHCPITASCTSHDRNPSCTCRPLRLNPPHYEILFIKMTILLLLHCFGRYYLYIIKEEVKKSEVIDDYVDKCLFSLTAVSFFLTCFVHTRMGDQQK